MEENNMTYAGLTTADKGALLDAKARGAEWVAREKNGALWGYKSKPRKMAVHETRYETWSSDGSVLGGIVDVEDGNLRFIQWNDAEPVNIDLALAQIAKMEMDRKTIDDAATDDIVLAEVYSLREKLKIAADIIHKLDPNYDVTEFLHQVGSADYDQREEDLAPLTWNERINQMTVEEKAAWSMNGWTQMHNDAANYAWEEPDAFIDRYEERMVELLNSPYAEGETK